MKLTKYFMPFAALALLASCSNDKLDGPAENGGGNNKGDLYFTMTISQALGTRTSSPLDPTNEEIGQDVENYIGSAILIITNPSNKIVTATKIEAAEIKGNTGKYAASFKMVRTDLETDINTNGSGVGDAKAVNYRLYLIANPSDDMVSAFVTNLETKKTQDIQDVFELDGTEAQYWTANKFLMTNADYAKKSITAADVKAGTHASETDALNLGEVKVQRAMSRLDLATAEENLVFSSSIKDSQSENIIMTFDGVALVNEAKKANLFKEVGTLTTSFTKGGYMELPGDGTDYPTGTYCYFRPELATNWVFTPDQTEWASPLFSGTGATQTGTQVNLAGLDYKTLTPGATLNGADNTSYTPNADDASNLKDPYYIWRYCMENSNYTATNQLNGNSTGIVFRAEMTGGKVPRSGNEEGPAVYAYNNKIIGTYDDLKAYTWIGGEGNEWNDQVALRFKDAKDKYIAANNLTTTEQIDAITEDNLKANLLAGNFVIYRPNDAGKYYSYYIYWNRHNNNNDNAEMGPMEFATVRNNVYKLAVTTLRTLGHPADPSDDPDPFDPGDEDEETDFWGEVTCIVLPWSVRINNIEF